MKKTSLMKRLCLILAVILVLPFIPALPVSAAPVQLDAWYYTNTTTDPGWAGGRTLRMLADLATFGNNNCWQFLQPADDVYGSQYIELDFYQLSTVDSVIIRNTSVNGYGITKVAVEYYDYNSSGWIFTETFDLRVLSNSPGTFLDNADTNNRSTIPLTDYNITTGKIRVRIMEVNYPAGTLLRFEGLVAMGTKAVDRYPGTIFSSLTINGLNCPGSVNGTMAHTGNDFKGSFISGNITPLNPIVVIAGTKNNEYKDIGRLDFFSTYNAYNQRVTNGEIWYYDASTGQDEKICDFDAAQGGLITSDGGSLNGAPYNLGNESRYSIVFPRVVNTNKITVKVFSMLGDTLRINEIIAYPKRYEYIRPYLPDSGNISDSLTAVMPGGGNGSAVFDGDYDTVWTFSGSGDLPHNIALAHAGGTLFAPRYILVANSDITDVDIGYDDGSGFVSLTNGAVSLNYSGGAAGVTLDGVTDVDNLVIRVTGASKSDYGLGELLVFAANPYAEIDKKLEQLEQMGGYTLYQTVISAVYDINHAATKAYYAAKAETVVAEVKAAQNIQAGTYDVRDKTVKITGFLFLADGSTVTLTVTPPSGAPFTIPAALGTGGLLDADVTLTDVVSGLYTVSVAGSDQTYTASFTVRSRNNVLFTDNESLLRNPYTGIFSYNVDNGPHGYDIRFSPDDTYTTMPEISHVYMRLAWSYFQPEEDIFDFSMIDSMIERCKQQDMQVALRITSAESGMEYATPKWVFDKGAVAHRWTWGNPNWVLSGGNVAPDWNDPIYLEYVEKFVKEFAKRYDGNENIAYIDVGMLGIWGEMHMNMGARIETIGPDVARKIFDIWRKYFTKTDLFILNNETFYPQLEDYAIQNNLFWRNDYLYIGGWGQGDAHVFAETEKRWQDSPINGELMHWASQIEGKIDGNGIIQSGTKAGQSAVDAIIAPYHLTYLGLHGYTKDIKERYAGYLESVEKKIGYRILPASVEFPAEANAHDTILVNANWKNVGVAPCYHGAYPALTLKNENGTIMSVMVDTEFNVKDLPAVSGDIVEEVTQEVQFKLGATLPGGNYKVYLSLGNAAGDPKIKMPIDGNDGENRYYIGDMKIRGDYSASATLSAEGLNVTITPYPDIPKGTDPYIIGDVYLAMYDVAEGGRLKPEADHFGDKAVMLTSDEIKLLVKDAFEKGEARSATFSPSRLGADEASFAGRAFEVYFYPMHYGSRGPNYFHIVSDNGFYAYLGVLSFDESRNMSFIQIDKTASVTTVTPSGTVRSDGTYNSYVAVTLTAQDEEAGSGVAGTEYSLDGIHWMTYTAPILLTENGIYNISCRTIDNAGNVETVKNISIHVGMDPDVMTRYLLEKIKGMNLEQGIANSLTSKLNNVINSFLKGNQNSTVNQIKAFMNEVDAQSGNKLSAEQANDLNADANKIIATVNSTRKVVEVNSNNL